MAVGKWRTVRMLRTVKIGMLVRMGMMMLTGVIVEIAEFALVVLMVMGRNGSDGGCSDDFATSLSSVILLPLLCGKK